MQGWMHQKLVSSHGDARVQISHLHFIAQIRTNYENISLLLLLLVSTRHGGVKLPMSK